MSPTMPVIKSKRFWLGIGAVGALALTLAVMPVAKSGGLLGSESHDRELEREAEGSLLARDGGEPDSPEAGENKPWYPGATAHEPSVTDAQHWDWLQQDLDRAIDETRPKARKRMSAEEFKEEYVGASMGYLDLGAEEAVRFEAAVEASLLQIEEARRELEAIQAVTPYGGEDADSVQVWKDAQAAFQDAQKDASERLAASLPDRSRTTLMKEQALRWIVRLDFGIRHAQRLKK